MGLKLALVFCVGIVGLIPLTWKQCVKLVLVLVVIEGAIRKWILPDASELVYFAKDGVMLVGALKFFNSGRADQMTLPKDAPLRYLIWLNCAVIGLEMCNYNLGSPFVGILGGRNYLLYIPLMILTTYLFDSQEELFQFLKWYLILSFPVFFVAVEQHFSPADADINSYVWGHEKDERALIGGHARVTATFSYLAGYAAYLQTMASLIIPLLVVELPPKLKWMFRAALACALAGMLLTGSRGPVITFVLFIIGYFFMNNMMFRLRLYKRFVLPGIVCALALLIWFQPILHQVSERFSQNADILPRIFSSFFMPIPTVHFSGFFGFGAGSTYQAAFALRAKFGLQEGTAIPVFFEAEPERVMLELGPLGFILWYTLRLHITYLLWRTYTRLTYPLLRELALTVFLLHLISIPGQMVFQITFMVYHWFTAGFIFLLPRIEMLETIRWKSSRRHHEKHPRHPLEPETAGT